MLRDTPVVLSVGRRCVKYGYDFHWPPYSEEPVLTTPTGKPVVLTVADYVPYLKTSAPAAPAAYGGSSGSADSAAKPFPGFPEEDPFPGFSGGFSRGRFW